MSLVLVRSSAIAAIGYEGGTLAVMFHNSGLYCHYGVPFSLYQGFLRAPSKGKYYNRFVRGRYR
jgi:hypothetical protein